jgi:hypothetical protein
MTEKWISCPECQRDIRTDAAVCEHCGRANDWTHPKHAWMLHELETGGWVVGEAFTWQRSGPLLMIQAQSDNKWLNLDFSGDVPEWRSNDEPFFSELLSRLEKEA